ncbi:hypothetical protein DVH24_001037 [Malus domestica]|uniref:Uncharacterized protein n=1 Tax=Malus domestica TaxID=3750 RepID=A0A498K571_MALDO|nr:hypothetical protein DVH24_001037 [Malus domestica]
MGKLMPPLCSFYLLYLIFITTFSVSMLVNSLTLDSDTQVLRLIKLLGSLHWIHVRVPGGGGVSGNLALDNSPSRITSIELDGSGYEGFITPSIWNLNRAHYHQSKQEPLSRTNPRYHF